MKVTNRTVRWEEGRLTVFDDSFEHQVWNYSGGRRLVLLVSFKL